MTQSNVGRPDLSRFDGAYAAAPTGDEDIPDGKYLARIENVELTTSREKQTPMLKWTLVITGPQFVGCKLWRYNLLATDENAAWLKKDLHRCDVDLEKLSDLPDHLHRLLDVVVEVTKRTRGEFTNVYINRRVSAGGEADAGMPF